VNLFFQFCATQGYVGFDVARAKEQSYFDWQHVDQFLPLVVNAFGYLHKQAYGWVGQSKWLIAPPQKNGLEGTPSN
jgi:hypothetical protein